MRISSEKIGSIILAFVVVVGILFNTTLPVHAAENEFIGTDGKVMPAAQAKQWRYEVIDNKVIVLHEYTGTFTSDGQINGVVPASINGLPVVKMWCTFSGKTELVKAPVIPNTVVSLNRTFAFCSNLVEAPVIPLGVTDLNQAFSHDTSLRTAPNIPASVVNMNITFLSCSNLRKAPVIPSSVKYLDGTFAYSGITEAPVLPANVINKDSVFLGCKF